jgi:hypothetical protein
MAKQTTDSSTSLHELARSEIARQVQALGKRRAEIVKERAELYVAFRKGVNTPSSLQPAEVAARQHAARLLNGATPKDLLPPPENSFNFSRDEALSSEQAGIDIALRILNSKDLEARAVEGVTWAEANRSAWRELGRERVLAVIRVHALGEQAAAFVAASPDIGAAALPFGFWTEYTFIGDKIIEEMTNDALAAGVITASDVKKARTK